MSDRAHTVIDALLVVGLSALLFLITAALAIWGNRRLWLPTSREAAVNGWVGGVALIAGALGMIAATFLIVIAISVLPARA